MLFRNCHTQITCRAQCWNAYFPHIFEKVKTCPLNFTVNKRLDVSVSGLSNRQIVNWARVKTLLFPCYIFRLAFEIKYILLLHLISIIWVTNYATTSLLLFYYCCNKLPQPCDLQENSFTTWELEVRIQKSVVGCRSHDVRKVATSWILKKQRLLCLFQHLESEGILDPWPVPCFTSLLLLSLPSPTINFGPSASSLQGSQ